MAFLYFIVFICCIDLVISKNILKEEDINAVELEERQLDIGDAPQVKPIGCYKDQQWDRALPVFYKSMRGHTPSEIIMGCAKAAVAKGFVYFGTQYGGECWGGKDGYLRYDIHGPADNCDKNIGTVWSNFVYQIERVDGYCVAHNKFYKYNTLVDENNPCETCTCQSDGHVVCHHKTCPVLPMSCEKKVTPSGQCCSVCACYHENKYYQNGDRWSWPLSNNGCEECSCSNNKADCQIKVCPTCSEYLDLQPGECCRACVPKPTIIIPTTTEEPILTLPPWPPIKK